VDSVNQRGNRDKSCSPSANRLHDTGYGTQRLGVDCQLSIESESSLHHRRATGPSHDELIQLPRLPVNYRFVNWTTFHDRLDQCDHHASKPSLSFSLGFRNASLCKYPSLVSDENGIYSVALFTLSISFSCCLDCCLDLGFHLSSSKRIFISDLLSLPFTYYKVIHMP
jgi:hypothetical protein